MTSPHEGGNALSINLRHLRALSAVAAAGSIAAAAEGLYRVASAVTRSISELEAACSAGRCSSAARAAWRRPRTANWCSRAHAVSSTSSTTPRAQLVARGGIGAGAADVRSLFASILNGRRLAVVASLAQTRNMATVAREFGITSRPSAAR